MQSAECLSSWWSLFGPAVAGLPGLFLRRYSSHRTVIRQFNKAELQINWYKTAYEKLLNFM